MENNLEVIPIFFAVDDGYIPFLAVALESLIQNASKEYYYSIKVLYTNINEENKKKINKYKCENVNIEFVESDLFDKLTERSFDIILSNPPYIETDIIKTLEKDVQAEPHLALDGGKDGLEFYKKILNEAHEYLKTNGYLMLEIGYNQGNAVINLAHKNLKLITKQPIKDLAGNDRVLIFRKEG